MTEKRWKQIEPFLNEFQGYLANDVQKLKIEQANDRAWSWDEYEKQNKEYEEQNKKKRFNQFGVYLIFDGDDEYALQYIGLAMDKFDNRIWSHEDQVKNRRFTDIIQFEHRYYFLAPALEFFLISKISKLPGMESLKNKTYKSYTIAESSSNQGVQLP